MKNRNNRKQKILELYLESMNRVCRYTLALESVSDSALPGAITYSDMPKGGKTPHSLDVWAVRKAELSETLEREKVRSDNIRHALEHVIERMDSENERRTLTERYLNLQSISRSDGETVRYILQVWDIIADNMGVSVSQAFRYHATGLDNIDIKLFKYDSE